ncbi:MAG: hypothetical protein FJW69_09400 [Actinobacteria bacterium]|nr:hypothetical protein [Actinomycetota bacterium]
MADYMSIIKNYPSTIVANFSLAGGTGSFPFYNLYFNFTDINLTVPFSLGYIFILILALFFQKKKQEKEWINFMIFFLVLFFILMRLVPPFDRLNYFLYRIPQFAIFRSSEKLFIFLPFFFIILLALLLNSSKFSKKITVALLVILLLIPFPFYMGGIPKYLDTIDYSRDTKSIIKFPYEYLNIKNILDKESLDLSIIDLPPSFDWQHYPELKYSGVNPFWIFYKNRYIATSNYESPLLNKSFEDYNRAGIVHIDNFLGLIKKFSGKYILVHKDLDVKSMKHSALIYETIIKLENLDIIKEIEDNDHFTLYELDKKYLVPLISTDNNTKLYFKKISPVKYEIFVSGLKDKTNIEFHQSYHSWWKIYINSNAKNNWDGPDYYYSSTSTTEYEQDFRVFDFKDFSYMWKSPVFDKGHYFAKGYANNWEVSPDYIKNNFTDKFYKENPDGSIDISLTIYFKGQIYFYGGLILIGIFFSSLFAFFFYKKIKLRKNNNQYG